MQLSGFDANQVEPNAPMEAIPADWYTVVITASEEKPTKAKTGSYLELVMEVIQGEYKGRKLFERLNLNNPNKTAVDIAQGELSSICRAVGVMMPQDSSDLHDRPLQVKVAVKPATEQYASSNEIKDYQPADGAGSMSINASIGSSTPPWKKK